MDRQFSLRPRMFAAASVFFGVLCLGCWLIASHTYIIASVGTKGEKVKIIEKKTNERDILMIVTMPEICVAGSAFEVKVRLENKGKQDVECFWFGKYEVYEFKLQNSRGRSVSLTSFGKIVTAEGRDFSGISVTLAAGKQWNDTLNLSRVFDLSQEDQYTLSIGHSIAKGLRIETMTFRVIAEPR